MTVKLAWHIVVRNWVVYKKDFIANISPTLADPGFLLASLGMGLGPFIQEINGMSYPQFLAPGLMATTTLFTAFFECSYGFYVRMTFESVFKAMLATPIGVREIVLGEFLWVFLKGALMAFGVGVVLAILGLVANPWVLPLVALIGGLLALPCGALGLISAGYVHNINQFQSVYSFLIAPMYFLSGVFFPITENPALRALFQISPFHHGVRLMQITVWQQGSTNEVLWHLGALFLFTALLGLWAYRRIERRLIA